MEEEKPTVANGPATRALLDLAVESWRFSRLFTHMLSKLDPVETARYANQLRYFLKRLDESLDAAGMHFVNLEGQPYDPGIAASALNLADFGPEDRLVVEQMIEPIVMGPEGLVKSGTVMLRKAD